MVTDSKALSALKVTTNMTGKLARWAMLLSEYDFELEHRSGTKMGNVDGMNRSSLPEEPVGLDDEQLAAIWEVGLEEEADGGWVLEPCLEGEVETCINEINLMRKSMLGARECNICGLLDG